MTERSVKGYAFTSTERPSRSYGTGRKCKDDECETRLSLYNPGKYCYLHEPMAVPRTRGKKIA